MCGFSFFLRHGRSREQMYRSRQQLELAKRPRQETQQRPMVGLGRPPLDPAPRAPRVFSRLLAPVGKPRTTKAGCQLLRHHLPVSLDLRMTVDSSELTSLQRLLRVANSRLGVGGRPPRGAPRLENPRHGGAHGMDRILYSNAPRAVSGIEILRASLGQDSAPASGMRSLSPNSSQHRLAGLPSSFP